MKLQTAAPILTALFCTLLLGCGKSDRSGKTDQSRPPTFVPAGSYEGSGPNLLQNGDFEKADSEDATLPLGWQRIQSTAETALLVPREDDFNKGDAVEIKAHPEGKYWQLLSQSLPLPNAETIYVVSFDGRVVTTGRGRVSLYVKKSGNKYERLGVGEFDNTEWEHHSFAVRVPSKGGEGLELRLGQGDYKSIGCVIQFDDIAVQVAAASQ